MNTVAESIFTIALFSVVLLVPVLVWRDQRKFERELAEGREDLRARSFKHTTVFQWVTAGLLFTAWLFTGNSLDSVFLLPGWSGIQWLTVVVGLAAAALMIAQTFVLRGREDQLASVRKKLEAFPLMALRDARELRLFNMLSWTAGICEELVYRGLLLGTLASWIGLWPAVCVSTLLFGLGHVYQGTGGVLSTAIAGGVAALLTVFSGSVYLAMVVHVILDLSQGRLFAMAMRGPDPESPAGPLELEGRLTHVGS